MQVAQLFVDAAKIISRSSLTDDKVTRRARSNRLIVVFQRSRVRETDHGTSAHLHGHESSVSGQKCSRKWKESAIESAVRHCHVQVTAGSPSQPEESEPQGQTRCHASLERHEEAETKSRRRWR